MKYPVVEIFKSIQGEGNHVGYPAIFVRLAGCNLSCEFCDTAERNDAKMGFMTSTEIRDVVRDLDTAINCALVVITGGEPTTHDLNDLCDELRDVGFELVIETNGVENPFPLAILEDVHYSVSPKPGRVADSQIWAIAGSVKLLCNMETTVGDIDRQLMIIRKGNYYPAIFLQPCVDNHSEYLDNPEVYHTQQLCLETGLPLSLQIHKLLRVR